MAFGLALLSALVLVLPSALAQLSGSVGPTTPLSEKQGTICSVLDYGGSVGSSVSLKLSTTFPNRIFFPNRMAVAYRSSSSGYRAGYWQRLYKLRPRAS